MAIMDDPDIKRIADPIRDIVEKNDIRPEFVKPTKEAIVEDIVKEATFAILDFPGWYFNVESSRNLWVPKSPGDNSDLDLYPIVKDHVEELLAELREPGTDPLPFEPDVEDLVNKLVGLVTHWQDWYYTLKKEKDMLDWQFSKNANDSIYFENNYGDVDKSPGVSNAYDEENEPWDDVDLDELVNTDLLD